MFFAQIGIDECPNVQNEWKFDCLVVWDDFLPLETLENGPTRFADRILRQIIEISVRSEFSKSRFGALQIAAIGFYRYTGLVLEYFESIVRDKTEFHAAYTLETLLKD